MPVLFQRVLAAAALALALLVGVWLSNKFPRESAARVQVLRAGERDAQSARVKLAQDRAELEHGDDAYLGHMAQLAAAWGLPAPTRAELEAPLVHAVELVDAVALQPGASWTGTHVRVTAVVERVTYKHQGVTVAANHTIARIENISSIPVAYLVRASSAERGRCEVRGSRMHNANALRPAEVADVVLCAGSGSVRLEHVEVIEVSEFQQRLLSQVSPRALGADDITAGAHQPIEAVELCIGMNAQTLAAMVRDGTTSWADVTDYFARHDCHRDAMPAGYTRVRAAADAAG
ncbi:MAG: hypothetical protein U0168_25545 [Nannocystaceae bacterium]